MDRAEAFRPPTFASSRSGRLPVWLLGWTLAAAVLGAKFGGDALNQKFYDPDNAMWLVSVRDLLAGQDLWDSTQLRLYPPDGTSMHWARWVVLLIAAPIALLTPVFGATSAEIITAFVWPLALLGVFMSLVVTICGRLGAGDGLKTEASIAGAIVAALAFPVTSKFSPGSFDHHTIELILALVAILALMKMEETPRWGWAAGLALGAMLATAAEGVPIAAAGMLAAGLLWLVRPDDYRNALARVGTGFAGSSIALFLIMVPPSRWAMPSCDAMSPAFLGFGLAGGAVAILLARALPSALRNTLGRRIAAAACLGGGALAVLWVLFPDCARGGYATMSEEMKTYWLAQIAETRRPLRLAGDDMPLFLGMAGAPFAALITAFLFLSRRWKSPSGWIAFAFLAVGWALFVWQIRGAFYAVAFAIPFGAWGIARARQAWKSGGMRAGILLFAAAGITAAPAAWSAVSEPIANRLTPAIKLQVYEDRKLKSEACEAPPTFAPLQQLPPAVLFNNFMLGPSVLQRTNHSVIAAPYHRNAEGLMSVITAMRSREEAAKAIVLGSPADYVVVCSGLPEVSFYIDHPADGSAPGETLASRLAKGDHPAWLQPVLLADTPLRLYRIVR